MSNNGIEREAGAAAELLYFSSSGGEDTLRRVVEAVRSVTGGTHAYVVHRTVGGDDGLVLAAAGDNGPRPMERVQVPTAAPPRRIVVPLSLDGTSLGSLISEGVVNPLRPEAHRELTLLAGLASRALQNHVLVEQAERHAKQEMQRHFAVLSGTTLHLNQALCDVTGTLEAMERESELTGAQADLVKRGRRRLGAALRLLSEFHELARASTGQLVPKLESVDLTTMLQTLVRSYQLGAGATGVSFNLDLQTLPSVRTDAECVRQILHNLLSNALRYSPMGVPVTVRAQTRAGRRAFDPASWVRIDVVDCGPGVAEGDAVFEEMQRAGRSSAPGFRLALSRRIARLLGGDLTLQSAPGSGSSFTLWLPLEN